MLKKRLVIFLLVFLVLLVSSCNYNNISSEQLEEGITVESPATDCRTVCNKDEKCVILCQNSDIINKAIDENNLNVCEQLSQNAKNVCKDTFYFKRSGVENNVELCNNILDENSKLECFDYYYFKKAMLTKDLSYCAKIKNVGMKSGCEAVK